MSLFGAIVRTTINTVILPVTLPLAIVKDTFEVMAEGDCNGDNTKRLIRTIKKEAEPKQ